MAAKDCVNLALRDWAPLADAERQVGRGRASVDQPAPSPAHLLGSVGSVGRDRSLRGEPMVLIEGLANGSR